MCRRAGANEQSLSGREKRADSKEMKVMMMVTLC